MGWREGFISIYNNFPVYLKENVWVFIKTTIFKYKILDPSKGSVPGLHISRWKLGFSYTAYHNP